MASNSLLEAVVYGRATGEALNLLMTPRVSEPRSCALGPLADAQRDPRWMPMRELMGQAMGPVRDGPTLHPAIMTLTGAIADCSPSDDILMRRFQLARAMMQSALARSESRGAHWRRDFPERDASRDIPASV